MKKSALFRMTLLFLLVGFTNVNATPSTSQGFNIPSYAVISDVETFSGWEKTIIWSDGTTETIRVDSYGNVYLNDSLGVPAGFIYFGFTTAPSSTVAETILDWEDAQGIRFVDVAFYTESISSMKSRMDFWFPKFYNHKRFVRLAIANRHETFSDTNQFQTGFNELIDYIDLNNWEDMVYAIEISHEDEKDAKGAGWTVSQLSSHLDTLNSYADTKLATSDIGSVPLIHSLNGLSIKTSNEAWVEKIAEKTDIIRVDFYPGTLSYMDTRHSWHQQRFANAGKDPASGYKVWYEFAHGFPEDNTQMTPEFYTHLLAYSDTADVFLWKAWKGWDASIESVGWYFDDNGNPEYWTEDFALYFP